MGGVKFDFLTVKILDKIRITMNHLITNGAMERQETLRETYDKYLSPAVLEYDNLEMWDKAAKGEIVSLFQFDTMVGSKAIREVAPHSLVEMATANSLMRLSSSGGSIQPLDKFIKFRKDISLWYEEMHLQGLNEDEIMTMKKHLDKSYGIAATQEDIMEILMDESISGFTVVEAHKARKAIAKKKAKLIDKLKEDYFDKAKERTGAREEIINYVWHHCVVPQLG